VVPIISEAKVPFIGPFTGAEGAAPAVQTATSSTCARAYYDETDKIVEQVISTGGKNIAVFLPGTTRTARRDSRARRSRWTRRGMKISALGTVERNTVKVEDAVKKINAAQPDAGGDDQRLHVVRGIHQADEGRRAARRSSTNVSFVGSVSLAHRPGQGRPRRRHLAGRAVPLGDLGPGGEGVPVAVGQGGQQGLQLRPRWRGFLVAKDVHRGAAGAPART